MPKKNYTNTLIVDEVHSDCDVLNLFTYYNKKAHFKISMPELYESIRWHLNDLYGCFQVRLSVYPYIAVHIYGRKDILEREKSALITKVKQALAENFDNGVSKIKQRAHL